MQLETGPARVDEKENCRNNCQNSVGTGKNGYTNESHKQKGLWGLAAGRQRRSFRERNRRSCNGLMLQSFYKGLYNARHHATRGKPLGDGTVSVYGIEDTALQRELGGAVEPEEREEESARYLKESRLCAG